MRVIKRYPNRKLYDTEAKQYITLDSIAALIRSGYEVQVIDNASGEELTALTLSQIIFEQEKRQSGFLPRSILTNLIQTGGDRFSSIQRGIKSPKAFLQQVDDEIRSRVQSLIAQGELLEAEGDHLLQKLIPKKQQSVERDVVDDDQLEQMLKERDIPSRDEFEEIINQLELLASKLDELSQNKS